MLTRGTPLLTLDTLFSSFIHTPSNKFETTDEYVVRDDIRTRAWSERVQPIPHPWEFTHFQDLRLLEAEGFPNRVGVLILHEKGDRFIFFYESSMNLLSNDVFTRSEVGTGWKKWFRFGLRDEGSWTTAAVTGAKRPHSPEKVETCFYHTAIYQLRPIWDRTKR